MAVKISDLGIQSNLADTDVMHLRTTGGIDRQVTGKNLKSVVQGYNNLYMTNIVGTAEPVFTGDVEVNSSLIALSSESGTGFGALATSSNVWVYVTTAGAVVYSATVPSWNGTKGGWYNGNDRAVAWMRKDSGDTHRYKHFLPTEQKATIVLKEIIEIGDWDMLTATGTSFKNTAHELAVSDIRVTLVNVRNDADNTMYPLTAPDSASNGLVIGHWIVDGTNISMTRVDAGDLVGTGFDNIGYDSTGYNRGFITIKHKAL